MWIPKGTPPLISVSQTNGLPCLPPIVIHYLNKTPFEDSMAVSQNAKVGLFVSFLFALLGGTLFMVSGSTKNIRGTLCPQCDVVRCCWSQTRFDGSTFRHRCWRSNRTQVFRRQTMVGSMSNCLSPSNFNIAFGNVTQAKSFQWMILLNPNSLPLLESTPLES